MTDESEEELEQENTTPTVEDLMNQLEDLRDNTVPKEDYEKLKQDNSKLITRLANERPVAKEKPKQEEPTQQELYDKLQANSRKIAEGDLNGLEYATLLVENHELEDKLGIDPFVGGNDETEELRKRDENTYKFLKDAITNSHGDPSAYEHYMEDNTIATNRR